MFKKAFFLLTFFLFICSFLVSGFYVGYDYGLDKVMIKEVMDVIPDSYFDGLTNIMFTDKDCVFTRIEYVVGGRLTACSKGMFDYWGNGRTRIRLAEFSDKNELLFTLLHELGHLKQWNNGLFDGKYGISSDVGLEDDANLFASDNYAILKGEGFYE